MAQINLPFSISYKTDGLTPVADIIEALRATDMLMQDAASLLPSLIDGLRVEQCSLNVRSLTQESPLRELFAIALLYTYQKDLTEEVPPLLESLFNIKISDKYDTLVTVVFLIVVFYGVTLVKDTAEKALVNHRPRKMLAELISLVARETGKTEDDVRRILEARFSKPGPVKKLVSEAKRFFLPSQKASNAPIHVDRHLIDTDTIREVPYSAPADQVTDFDRYTPYHDVTLEVHAMDRDKSATGWAAVIPSVSDKRLKMRVLEPLSTADIFGKQEITGDVVVVSKLTSDGFVPSEIHLTALSR